MVDIGEFSLVNWNGSIRLREEEAPVRSARKIIDARLNSVGLVTVT
jgi:hypothetical protein